MAGIFQKLGNMKARALIVIVLVVIVVAIIMVWTAIRSRPADLIDTGSANTKRIGKGLDNLPGTGEASPVYDPLQVEENKKKAEEALKGTGSAVPTLVNQGGDQYGRSGFDLGGSGRCGDECYDEKGYDEAGFDRNGYNATGFDKNGLDKNGLDKNGFDKNGFDKDGYDKNGFDKNGFDKNGFDKDGFDRFGYDKDGFDRNGCNRQGFNREGKPCTQAFGADCFNKLGLDTNGCNREGMGPDGKACYNKDGFNAAGFNKCGFDKDGFSKDGLDRNGCNREGKDKNGKACYGINGLTAAGLDKYGIDKNGFGPDGFDKNGFDKEGFDKDGFDKDGFDRNGCNREGKNRAGKACYDAKGFNDAGFDKQGYDKDGYDKDGFDKQGYDRDGYDKDGFNRLGCNRQGLNREGKPCQAGVGTAASGEISTDLLANLRPGTGTAGTGTGTGNVDATQAAAADYQRLLAEQSRLDAQRNAELSEQQRAQALADQQARLEAYEALMNTQAQAILQSWAPPSQVYVKGKAPVEVAAAPAGPTTVNGLMPYGKGPIIQKAGDMLYAVIETSINSDEPGPVLARIVSQGELSGAKIMGTFERQDQKLFVRFNVLSVDSIPQSIAIDAVAVDPETARTSLASSVDNHTLEKYGTLLASSFLQGMGEAVETSLGTPELDSSGSATIASQVPATSRDQVIVGLGKVGQAIGQELESKNIQPTVTLDSGTGVGLLLMSDLRIEQPPPSTTNAPLRADAPLAPGEKPATAPGTTPGTAPAAGPVPGAPNTTTTTTNNGTSVTSTTQYTRQRGVPGSLVNDNMLTSEMGEPFSGL